MFETQKQTAYLKQQKLLLTRYRTNRGRQNTDSKQTLQIVANFMLHHNQTTNKQQTNNNKHRTWTNAGSTSLNIFSMIKFSACIATSWNLRQTNITFSSIRFSLRDIALRTQPRRRNVDLRYPFACFSRSIVRNNDAANDNCNKQLSNTQTANNKRDNDTCICWRFFALQARGIGSNEQ